MITDIKKYDFNPGLPHEFEIVDLAHIYRNPEKLYGSPHRTNFYAILWFTKGKITHLVDFEPVEVLDDTLLFLRKDVVHSFDAKNEFEGYAILFTDNFFCKTDHDIKFLRSTVLYNDLFSVSKIQISKTDNEFSETLRSMQSELQNKNDRFQSDILRNNLYNFLLFSERKRRGKDFTEIKKSADLDYVMLFRDVLEAHYKGHRQVTFYASQLIITEKRLNQATAKVLGKTPKQIIGDRIVLEAKRLLVYTTESVKEIGFRLGFDEPTYFIQFFKKHSSSTPLEFREKQALA
jgi:AraC family transcriptional regulator, transcriptional activator of pobA